MKLLLYLLAGLLFLTFYSCSDKKNDNNREDEVNRKISLQIEDALSNTSLLDTDVIKYSFYLKEKNVDNRVKRFSALTDSFQTVLSRIQNSKFDSLKYAFMDFLKTKNGVITTLFSIRNLNSRMDDHANIWADSWNQIYAFGVYSMSERIKYEGRMESSVKQGQNDARRLLAQLNSYEDELTKLLIYQKVIKNNIITIGMNKNLIHAFEFLPDNKQVLNKVKKLTEERQRYWDRKAE